MKDMIERIIDEVGQVFVGNRQQVRLAVCCLLAGGHLLLEDLPGLGKTTLARALAQVLGLRHNRIQFTADLLPADILGMSVFRKDQAAFEFHPGPVFTEVLLADEINRATPRTQSALLEAMSESQVTIDGETRSLPNPFFVIATQNPVHQSGTYPLPESQLDRFLMRLSLGYPEPEAERTLLTRTIDTMEVSAPPTSANALSEIKRMVEGAYLSESLLDYVQRLIAITREAPECAVGLSPRGGMSLARAARAWAVMMGRDHVVPEDIQAVWVAVVAHRVLPAQGFSGDGEALANTVLERVDVVGGGFSDA
jgi:MoxR-like ATPase